MEPLTFIEEEVFFEACSIFMFVKLQNQNKRSMLKNCLKKALYIILINIFTKEELRRNANLTIIAVLLIKNNISKVIA